MKRIFTLTFFIGVLGLLNPATLLAQPKLKGCHYSWGNEKMEPLTEKQKADLKLSSERSDTIDILNYNINLEVIDFNTKRINGHTTITFATKLEEANRIEVNLLEFNVDSVHINGENVNFNNDGLFVTVPFPETYIVGETQTMTIWYRGRPTVDPSGFGGFDFQDGIAYNLGIGLGSNPYNYGRGWYPCFDNFVERATYDFNITSRLPRKAYCSGTFLQETVVTGDTITRSFRLGQEIPSYLAGVAVGEFAEHNAMHDGLNADIPIQLLASPSNIQDMINSFVDLGGVIDALEYWYGPYAWNRVGYVTTQRGAMEHSENIAFPTFSAIGGNTFDNRRLIAHELAHHWWGNVAGIPGPSDMWFKEGNAEYSAHLITEQLFGREAFLDQVIDNHLDVLSGAHIEDGDFLPLSGIPFENTYGTHTYNKGASMMHNLRGYLGDEGFRTGMTSVQENLGFQSITADDFRQHLTDVTGTDLVDFFEDWLKNPGWSGYSVENLVVTPQGNKFLMELDVFQGLWGTERYHNNVPLKLKVHGPNGEVSIVETMVSGELTPISAEIDFDPQFVIVDEDHLLNLAQVKSHGQLTEPGLLNLQTSSWLIQSTEQSGPAEIWVDQKWFGVNPNTVDDVRFGKRRFWDLQGYFPENHDFSATLQYRGNGPGSIDYDLLSQSEDSLILAWKPNFSDEWIEYPDYAKNVFGNPNDGIGNIIVFNIRPGLYSFANGSLPVTGTSEVSKVEATLFPNPSTGLVQTRIDDLPSGAYSIKIYGTQGTVLQTTELKHQGGFLTQNLDLSSFGQGLYWIIIEGTAGKVFVNQSVTIIQ